MLLAKTNGAVEGMKWCNLKTNSAHANTEVLCNFFCWDVMGFVKMVNFSKRCNASLLVLQERFSGGPL